MHSATDSPLAVLGSEIEKFKKVLTVLILDIRKSNCHRQIRPSYYFMANGSPAGPNAPCIDQSNDAALHGVDRTVHGYKLLFMILKPVFGLTELHPHTACTVALR